MAYLYIVLRKFVAGRSICVGRW